MDTEQMRRLAQDAQARADDERIMAGPWGTSEKFDEYGYVWVDQMGFGPNVALVYGIEEANFIAHARTDVPALADALIEAAAEIERLTQERDALQEAAAVMRLALFSVRDISFDRDGCTRVESMGKLIDELHDIADAALRRARGEE